MSTYKRRKLSLNTGEKEEVKEEPTLKDVLRIIEKVDQKVDVLSNQLVPRVNRITST